MRQEEQPFHASLPGPADMTAAVPGCVPGQPVDRFKPVFLIITAVSMEASLCNVFMTLILPYNLKL